MDYRAVAFFTALSYLADGNGRVRTTWSEAASRLGVAESTVRRWRPMLERAGATIATTADGDQQDTVRVQLPAYRLAESAWRHWFRGAWSPTLCGHKGEPIGVVARLVYAGLLAHKRGAHKQVKPSTRRLAALACIASEETVARAIVAELVPAGLVRIVTPGRAGVSTVYAVEAARPRPASQDHCPAQVGGDQAAKRPENAAVTRGVSAADHLGGDTPRNDGGNPARLRGDTPRNDGAQEEESEDEGRRGKEEPDTLPPLREWIEKTLQIAPLSPADVRALEAFVAAEGEEAVEIIVESVAGDEWRMAQRSRRRLISLLKPENVDRYLWDSEAGRSLAFAREQAKREERDRAYAAERARKEAEAAEKARVERLARARAAHPNVDDAAALDALRRDERREQRARFVGWRASDLATPPPSYSSGKGTWISERYVTDAGVELGDPIDTSEEAQAAWKVVALERKPAFDARREAARKLLEALDRGAPRHDDAPARSAWRVKCDAAKAEAEAAEYRALVELGEACIRLSTTAKASRLAPIALTRPDFTKAS